METSGRRSAFLSATDVADRLGVHPDTVRRMWEAGALPYTQVNGRRVTPAGALEKWIEGKDDEALRNVVSPEEQS